MKPLKFTPEMLTRKRPSRLDIETTLAHFAIITYLVEPDALRRHIPKRFELDCITAPDGTQKGLISTVPFVDQDFRFVRFPWAKWRFGQTNYRAYVTDSESGEHVVWFFGTALDSFSVNIPRYAWKLPWHRASIQFDSQYDTNQQRYTKYGLVAQSSWAPATLELEDSGEPVQVLTGFPNLETGLVLLTHPLRGFYYRRDGKIGSYTIWHDKLKMTEGRIVAARFPLLQRLGLVQTDDLTTIHSVLMQPEAHFTVYLPPVAIG
ncbi:DUF2071 domain-containing protein [Candidatus Leptofilum sp.]|uniref:DUF2071 domain-containing protein n=1 Tax=Candidatus Leptofilum sp. TaxID=3241576 RepID=UPI003B5B8129